VQTLEAHPKIRDFIAVGERIASEPGMIKSAAGAAAYLVKQANPGKKGKLAEWYEGVIDGAGPTKNDPQLVFRRTMFAMARKQACVVQRRCDTRKHGALYLKAFNAWAAGETITQLPFTAREPVPAIAKLARPTSSATRSLSPNRLVQKSAGGQKQDLVMRSGEPGTSFALKRPRFFAALIRVAALG
jgi:hypothetical protein